MSVTIVILHDMTFTLRETMPFALHSCLRLEDFFFIVVDYAVQNAIVRISHKVNSNLILLSICKSLLNGC